MSAQPDAAAGRTSPPDRAELQRQFSRLRATLVVRLARLVGPFDAEELANETLLRALAAVDGFRGDAALGTWLHRIAVNLAYDLLRQRQRDLVVVAESCADLPSPVGDASAEDRLGRSQMSRCVHDLLAELPFPQRDVLVQADMLGRSAPEIARSAGISVANAKIRLHRARRAMRAALETHCDFHHQEAGILCCTPRPAR